MDACHYWHINGRRRLINNRFSIIVSIFFLSLLIGVNGVTAERQASTATSSSYALQAGALGDDASRGNIGVRAAIRTHIENVFMPDYDQSFWVGDNLANGAFIQFGYMLVKAGHYCLHGGPAREAPHCQSEHVESGDGRWFWQYWPKINVPEYYYGIGPAHSAGTEGTWHTYAMASNGSTGWSFVLDGQVVDEINVDVASSKNAAYVVAEVVTSSPTANRNFGPVEFSNLTYYAPNGWHLVKTLTTVSGCGLNINCNVPYVATVIGPNHLLVTSTIKN